MLYPFCPLTSRDEPLVWVMLAEAACEPSVEAVRGQPELGRYAEGWGRPGDMGIGVFEGHHIAVGAVWLRLWPAEMTGFATADPGTPELAMGMLPEHRGLCVGTELFRRVIESARGTYPAIALSVRAQNPVIRLYTRSD